MKAQEQLPSSREGKLSSPADSYSFTHSQTFGTIAALEDPHRCSRGLMNAISLLVTTSFKRAQRPSWDTADPHAVCATSLC